MIVPGVLNGSQGPLFYPLNEISKGTDAWNNMPIVENHPTEGSARTPDIINEFGMGTVFNAETNGKLVAEGWFDVEKTRIVNHHLLIKLQQNKPIELSTGLYTTNVAAPKGAVFNNVAYSAIATEHRPDHLAVLPTSEGACSVKQGCGVNVNENKIEKHSDPELMSENEKSQEERRRMLNRQLSGRFTQDEPSPYIIRVFDDRLIYEAGGEIFQLNYERTDDVVTLSKEKPQKVERDEVFSVVSNVEPTSSGPTSSSGKESTPVAQNEQNEQNIDFIIANCSCWSEDDRETLNAFDPEKISAIKTGVEQNKTNETVANAARAGFVDGDDNFTFNEETGNFQKRKEPKKEEPIMNAAGQGMADQPLTTEQWMETAPPQIRSAVRNAMQIEATEKAGLIEKLTSSISDNSQKEVTTNRLNKLDLETLRDMTPMIQKPVETPSQEGRTATSYFGQASPAGITENEDFDNDDEVLDIPSSLSFAGNVE